MKRKLGKVVLTVRELEGGSVRITAEATPAFDGPAKKAEERTDGPAHFAAMTMMEAAMNHGRVKNTKVR